MEKQVFTGELAAEALPGRRPDGHKGDFGRVSITGGSVGLRGPRCWRLMGRPGAEVGWCS